MNNIDITKGKRRVVICPIPTQCKCSLMAYSPVKVEQLKKDYL